MANFTHRIATEADIPALVALMDRSITGPLAAFLTPDQITASRKLMGIDSQIIADRTYVIVEADGELAGCGGWSGRITEYGGDHTPGRKPAPLTPGVDAARHEHPEEHGRDEQFNNREAGLHPRSLIPDP